MDYQFHEAADIFPLPDEDDLASLADDIRAHGLQRPIELLDGKIIDGRRRKTACLLAGIDPEYVEIATEDPVAYVMSVNPHRRRLSPTQLAMAGARAKEFYDKAAVEKGRSRDRAAEAVGVGGRSIDYAVLVLRQGTPELISACDKDRFAASTAARVSARPDEEQREFLKSARGCPGSRSEADVEPKDRERPADYRGSAIIRANEAVDALKRIPKNDPLRKRGFQIVTDWIKANR